MEYRRTYVTNPYLIHIMSALARARRLAGEEEDFYGATRVLETLTAILPQHVRNSVLTAIAPEKREIDDFLAKIPSHILTKSEEEELSALQWKLVYKWLSVIIDALAQHGIALWNQTVTITDQVGENLEKEGDNV